jgi:probable HAF family extracellular repeat protein
MTTWARLRGSLAAALAAISLIGPVGPTAARAEPWPRYAVADVTPPADRADRAVSVTVTDIGADGTIVANGRRADSPGWTVPLLIAPDGRVTELDAGPYYGRAYGINADGEVVGVRFDAPTPDAQRLWARAVVWRGGNSTDLPTPAGMASAAIDVNAGGVVLGFVARPEQGAPQRAVLWRDDRLVDLGLDGFTPRGIDDAGDVAGLIEVPGTPSARGHAHAALWRGWTLTDLGTLGGDASLSVAVGARGQVVGVSGTVPGKPVPEGNRAFLWQDGAMAALPQVDPGEPDEGDWPAAVNAAGIVVGRRRSPDPFLGLTSAVLWANGRARDLNDLIPAEANLMLTEALAINDAGQIAARGEGTGGEYLLLLTPLAPDGPTPQAPAAQTVAEPGSDGRSPATEAATARARGPAIVPQSTPSQKRARQTSPSSVVALPQSR